MIDTSLRRWKWLALLATGCVACALAALAQDATTERAAGAGTVTPARGSHGGGSRASEITAIEQLGAKWRDFGNRKAATPAPLAPQLRLAPMAPEMERQLEATMTAPERESLARRTTTSFTEPETLRSADGELRVTLVAAYALNRIGEDPVFLRSYNGNLVGPTLRARPGDTLRITLKNDMDPEPEHPGMMNRLHGFNTTNLHTHGLHVSPSGISDNVLIAVGPRATQEYEIVIPVNHAAGTFWYHAHRHGSTAGNVASGMSGALIIEGGLDDVPEIRAARERVLVLNQIPYIYKNSFTDPRTGEVTTFDLPEGRVEVEYAQYLFGPGDWQALGRFTTVNGVQLPVLRMRPGAVERWRIIDSGQRERIELKLMRSPGTNPAAPETLPFHEIAVDSLPLGKKARRDTVELWPGYRSDVLIQAPAMPGEYLLLDEETPAEASLNGVAESRKHLARIVVEGDPALGMNLPEDAALAKLRPPSIQESEVTGKQEAIYGIVPNPNGPGVLFTINGQPFDMNRARTLKLGGVDEWTLASRNNVGVPVHHPFHIHVNPFEVISMKDGAGEEKLTEPVWRDTIILREGWTVQMRTRYEDFTGMFVQHCHILDHEDQGMMELLDIVAPDAPAGASAVLRGQRIALAADAPAQPLPAALGEFGGQPLLIAVVRSVDCMACRRQIGALAKAAAEKGWPRTVILAPDAEERVALFRRENPLPLPVISDPATGVLKRFAPAAPADSHALLLLDGKGRLRWQQWGEEPLLDFAALRAELPAAKADAALRDSTAAAVIEVWETPEPTDDYITWSPTPCTIRLAAPAPQDVAVVLTNDPPQPPKPGRTRPSDGDVSFAERLDPEQTATLPTLPLRLPADGTPVRFFIAGKFDPASGQGRPSASDKDCVIEVREGAPTGPVIARHALMVRIRKNVNDLEPQEMKAYLSGLEKLHAGGENSVYESLVRMHGDAAGRDPRPWRDLSHKGSGFIPWHRAFLLLFERALQKEEPGIALPYWRMDLESQIFTEDFLGTNPTGGPLAEVPVGFATDNPLFGWFIESRQLNGVQLGALIRNNLPRAGVPVFPGGEGVAHPESVSIADPDYDRFHREIEPYSHDRGHGWVGAWMGRCEFSPADPVFWMFHCEWDRLWAKWQHTHDRFATAGTDPAHYAPLGNFNPAGAVPLGHYLHDPMWPWDGSFTPEDQMGSTPELQRRPTANPYGAFPKAPIAGLWPAAPAAPTPLHMIDYLGLAPQHLPQGFCYDDVPHGPAPQPPAPDTRLTQRAALDPSARQLALGALSRADTPEPQRLAALKVLSPRLDQATADAIAATARSPAAGPAVQAAALSTLTLSATPRSAEVAAEQLATSRDAGVRLAAVEGLAHLMHVGSLPAPKPHFFESALARALDDPDPLVQQAALRALVPMGDAMALRKLERFLAEPAAAPREMPAVQLIHLAAQARTPAMLQALRSFLEDRRPETAAAAAWALAGDRESAPARLALLKKRDTPLAVREAALESLPRDSEELPAAALDIVQDATEPATLRAKAAAILRIAKQTGTGGMKGARLDEAVRTLRKAGAESTDEKLRRTISTTLESLNRP